MTKLQEVGVDTSFPDMASASSARLACQAAGLSPEHGISCVPFGDSTPPCITGSGRFFHLPLDVLPVAASHAPPRVRPHGKDYSQCRARRRDADWPLIFEPHAQRTESTRTVSDVVKLLRGRTVTIVGPSDTANLMQAIFCALASARLLESHGCRWRHWGWARFGEDNCACEWDVPRPSVAGVPRSRPCAASASAGYSFDTMLNASDVVVV
eukprot:6239626-Prymnesium_polylepis.1